MAFRIYIFCALFLVIIYGVLAVKAAYNINEEGGLSSNIRKWGIQFSWLYLISFSIIIIVALSASEVNASEEKILRIVQVSFSLIASTLILFLGYRYGILYPLEEYREKQIESTNVSVAKNSSKADLNLFEKIDALIQEEKLYLNQQLTLSILSQKMKINKKYLSQAINNTQGKSFTQYINELRIEHFIQKLKDENYKNLSFEALARECGFNSISAFNRSFKNVKGLTPSQYRSLL